MSAEKKKRKEELEYITTMINRGQRGYLVKTRSQVELTILETKFKRLQENLKL